MWPLAFKPITQPLLKGRKPAGTLNNPLIPEDLPHYRIISQRLNGGRNSPVLNDAISSGSGSRRTRPRMKRCISSAPGRNNTIPCDGRLQELTKPSRRLPPQYVQPTNHQSSVLLGGETRLAECVIGCARCSGLNFKSSRGNVLRHGVSVPPRRYRILRSIRNRRNSSFFCVEQFGYLPE